MALLISWLIACRLVWLIARLTARLIDSPVELLICCMLGILVEWMCCLICCSMVCLVKSLIGWSIDGCLFERWLDLLLDGLLSIFSDWLFSVAWLIFWLCHCLFDCSLLDRLLHWMIDCSIDWMFDGFSDWFIDCLLDWSVIWLIAWLLDFCFVLFVYLLDSSLDLMIV